MSSFSGCGKSSLLRIIGGLWAFDSGTISRPQLVGRGGIFFVPQRPYITLGTLRQQIVYPHTVEQQMETDTVLENILATVGLSYLLVRWGFDRSADWADMLSGGEQQRMGFARLLYHRPAFAVMDEATSALDEDLQQRCLLACKEAKISMINVAHRPSVIAFHELVLMYASPGKFDMIENSCECGPVSGGREEVESV